MLILPDPVVEGIGGIKVVRDDLLLGGTKMRGVQRIMQTYNSVGYVYASPCQGYAQIALAVVGRMMGRNVHIFCAKRTRRHERTEKASAHGAVIHEVENGYLSVVSARAKQFANDHGMYLIPFGIQTDDMMQAISEAALRIVTVPNEVWTVAGSGTLSLALQKAWPTAAFNAVCVGKHHDRIGNANVWYAPERYERSAKEPPPFPSCDNYDAKAWRFIKRHASPGALFWNVAR